MSYPDLTSSEELASVLGKHGITLSASLGQNFLICREVVEATVTLLQDGPKQVTELGPGVGTLTQGLIGAGLQVRAIEKDDDFVNVLPSVLPPKMRETLEIVHGDLKDEDWGWDSPYQLVGNIPYNLSGLIMRRLTQLAPAPYMAVLLVQKEVGERIVAQPPQMNLLGLSVALWGEAQMVMNVPASCFYPAPKVDSGLVVLTPSSDAPPVAIREATLKVAKIFFQQKRKQIGGVMKKAFKMGEEDCLSICTAAAISPEARPQELSAEAWIQLAKQIQTKE